MISYDRTPVLVARPVPVAMHGKCQVIELIGVDFSTLRPHGTLARGTGSIPWALFHSCTFGIRCAALSFSTGASGGAMMATPRCDTAQNGLFFSLLRFHQFAQVRFSAAGQHRLTDYIPQLQNRLEISSTGHKWIEDFDVNAAPAWKPLVASKN